MARGRKIEVRIVGDEKDLVRAFKSSSGAGKRWAVSMGTIAKGALVFGGVTAAVQGLSRGIRASVDEFSEQATVAAQTQAVLKSTGGVAGVAAGQVDKLASSISRYSGIDDEAVQAGENLLLTFTQIRNGVGKGNDVFNQATKAAADLSQAMGLDMTRAALQVGKALNDPERGYARLQRIGVAFTKTQVDLIKHFAKTGQTAKAQGVILAELNREFGGSAKAFGETIPGQIARARESLRNLGGELVGTVAPAFATALESLTGFLSRFNEARGARAKLNIVFEGVQEIGRKLFVQVRNTLASIDWPQAVTAVQQGLARGLERVGEFLGRVDWRKVGKAVGDSIVAALQGVAKIIENTDWANFGKALVNGVGRFLGAVNWKAVAVSTIRLLVAALSAVGDLLGGAGEALGKAVMRGIISGLKSLATVVERAAINIVLKIAKALDFKILGRSVVPGMGSIVDKLEAKLESLAVKAEETGGRVKTAMLSFSGTIQAGISALQKKIAAAIAKGTKPRRAVAPGGLTPTPFVPTPTVGGAGGATTTPKWIAEWQKASDRLQLIVDRASAALEKAGATKTLRDDIAKMKAIGAALNTQEKAIQAQLRLHKGNLDLQNELLDVQRQQVSNEQAIADAVKTTNDRIRERGQAIKDAALARLDRTQDNRDTQRALDDAKTALRRAQQIGGKRGILEARRDLQDAELARKRTLLEQTSVKPGKGGDFNFDGATFHFHGIQNPQQLLEALRKLGKTNTGQVRGRNPGFQGGV